MGDKLTARSCEGSKNTAGGRHREEITEQANLWTSRTEIQPCARKLKRWPCLQGAGSGLRSPLKSWVNVCIMNNTLFPSLLFRIINSLPSFLPERSLMDYQKCMLVSFWFFFSLKYLIQREVKLKGQYLVSNSEHPTYNMETKIAHYILVRTHCTLWVIIPKLLILLPPFLFVVEFISLIQHAEELLTPQAAFEAFPISPGDRHGRSSFLLTSSTRVPVILYLVHNPGIRNLLFW